MLSLPVDLLSELAKDIHFAKSLVTMAFGSRTFRWTDCDQNVYYSGWYMSHPIEYEAIEMGQDMEARSVKITVSNVDRTFTLMALSEDMRNKVCQIKQVYLTKNLSVIGTPVLVFYGYTDQITITKRKAEINVSDELIRWRIPCPARIHQDKCMWREFKGVECGYVDGTAPGDDSWCDRSYERCAVLLNTDNFGGFRFMSDLQDKEIWWGRMSKSYKNATQWAQSGGF